MARIARSLTGLLLTFGLMATTAPDVEAQRRGNGQGVTASVEVTLSSDLQSQVRAFYSSRPASGVEALPPGIRRRLERGKPLPPGIAKKSAPPELLNQVEVRDGFDLVEVGLDVLLVEVATGVIHDVLMDVIR